jgi:4'-phosphopantetheinyl transferase
MAETWFSPVESARLFTLAPEKQLDGFYHVWTQKEAFVKAHGVGLSLPLDNFSVEVDSDVPGGIQTIRGGSERVSAWKMFTNVPEPGWRLAVCVQTDAVQDVHWYMPTMAEFISFLGD